MSIWVAQGYRAAVKVARQTGDQAILTSYHTSLSWSFVSVRLDYFCNNWLVDIEWMMPCAPVLNEITS